MKRFELGKDYYSDHAEGPVTLVGFGEKYTHKNGTTQVLIVEFENRLCYTDNHDLHEIPA